MRLMRGSPSTTGHDLLRQRMALDSGMMPLSFEEMQGQLFDTAFKNGAKMLQWGKLSRTEVQTRGGADRKTWEALKVKADVEQTVSQFSVWGWSNLIRRFGSATSTRR